MTKIKHDEIKILDDRQQARDKISIWFGSNNNYYHPVKEIIANSCDEIMNNYEDGVVTVNLSKDGRTITISDTGRGIPLHGDTDGIKNYDVLFRKLFAGTKYEESEDTTTGTNGVGMAVVCMTSEMFKVTSMHNGRGYSIRFDDGGLEDSGLITDKINDDKHGTTISFKLDDNIYTETTFESDRIQEIIESFAIASANKGIRFIYKHNDIEKVIKFNSLKDYFEGEIGNKTTSKIVHLENTSLNEGGESSEFELLFTTQPNNFHKTYLNLTDLEEGGSIHNGIVYGIREYCSEYCLDEKLFKGKVDRFMPSDIENSVTFVANMFNNNVEFSNQTKLSTGKQLYRDIALSQTKIALDHFRNSDKENFDKFIKHLLTVQSHNAKNQRATNRLRRELTRNIQPINNRVDKLVDCKTHDDMSELFIAEGDSAKGALVSARDPNFQAVYPIRGKILNCIDSTEERILKNKEVSDLIKIIGTGIESKNKNLNSFDIENLRYNRIILATDQDEDGMHIATLLLGMIYRLMPELLTKGHVYLAQTPLYEIKFSNDEVIHVMNEKEMNEYNSKLKNRSYTISRAKGLGELDAEVLAKAAMNKDTRQMIQVKVDNIEQLGKRLEDWLGKDVKNRKTFIEDNLDKYTSEVD